MFEADGVDGGAICKRGFIHLQFAEKPEAPEAERHLGSWILERRKISFLPFGQDRRTLAYVGWHRRWCSRARLSPTLAPTYSTYSRECFRNTRTHGAAILAFGGLNSSGVEVAPLLCFLDSSVVVKSRVTVSPRVSKCSNLHAVGPGSEVLVISQNFVDCKYSRANGCVLQDFSKTLSR
ncbi:hypothetical protein V1477_020231 [Vespula maculifrons]|uniref:Uncharacterized protein n=1 Tax=Vespula maculifrons TaxID=7453 RepID=A0ABD2ALC4_VESMC